MVRSALLRNKIIRYYHNFMITNRKSGNFHVVTFHDKISSGQNFVAKNELRNFFAFNFRTPDRKKRRSSRTLRLSLTPQSGHLHSLGTLLVRDPSVLAALPAFLALVIFTISLMAITCEGRREDNDPLGSNRLSFGLKKLRIDIISST